MIHVNHDRDIDGGRGKPRIVRLAEADGDVLKLQRFHALPQILEIGRLYILREDAALRPDNGRKPDCEISASRADIGHGHARSHA
jgi:hypothetical protein